MDAKKYLSRAFVQEREIKRKQRQLDMVRGTVPYSAPLYGDVKIDSNMRGSAVEHAALREVALSDEIKEMTDELSRLMKEIGRTIKRIDNSNVEAVLEMRYLSFMGWEEIAECLRFSARHVFRLHRIGLKRVENYV